MIEMVLGVHFFQSWTNVWPVVVLLYILAAEFHILCRFLALLGTRKDWSVLFLEELSCLLVCRYIEAVRLLVCISS